MGTSDSTHYAFLVSIALTIGLCLAAAGFHLFLSVKGQISHTKEDMSECLAF